MNGNQGSARTGRHRRQNRGIETREVRADTNEDGEHQGSQPGNGTPRGLVEPKNFTLVTFGDATRQEGTGGGLRRSDPDTHEEPEGPHHDFAAAVECEDCPAGENQRRERDNHHFFRADFIVEDAH